MMLYFSAPKMISMLLNEESIAIGVTCAAIQIPRIQKHDKGIQSFILKEFFHVLHNDSNFYTREIFFSKLNFFWRDEEKLL